MILEHINNAFFRKLPIFLIQIEVDLFPEVFELVLIPTFPNVDVFNIALVVLQLLQLFCHHLHGKLHFTFLSLQVFDTVVLRFLGLGTTGGTVDIEGLTVCIPVLSHFSL